MAEQHGRSRRQRCLSSHMQAAASGPSAPPADPAQYKYTDRDLQQLLNLVDEGLQTGTACPLRARGKLLAGPQAKRQTQNVQRQHLSAFP